METHAGVGAARGVKHVAGRQPPHDGFNHFLRANRRKQPCYCSRGQGIRLSSALIWDWFRFGGVLIRDERSQTAKCCAFNTSGEVSGHEICASDGSEA